MRRAAHERDAMANEGESLSELEAGLSFYTPCSCKNRTPSCPGSCFPLRSSRSPEQPQCVLGGRFHREVVVSNADRRMSLHRDSEQSPVFGGPPVSKHSWLSITHEHPHVQKSLSEICAPESSSTGRCPSSHSVMSRCFLLKIQSHGPPQAETT